MVSKAKLNKEELQVVIDNIKNKGGDATELEGLMVEVVKEEEKRNLPWRRPLVQPSLFGEGEVPLTSVGEYWNIYHTLQEPLELGDDARRLKAEIEALVQKGLYSLDPNKSLEKHCIIIGRLRTCPWAKDICVCNVVRGGGRCKMGLLRQ